MKKILILLMVLLTCNTYAQRKLFNLTLDATPLQTHRIAIGENGVQSKNIQIDQFITLVKADLDTYTQAEVNTLLTNYLSKTNVILYVPTEDNHPATKKYVDDGGLIVAWTDCVAAANITLTNCKASQVNNIVYVTGIFNASSASVGAVIFTLPLTIDMCPTDWYDAGAEKSNDRSITPLQLNANTRTVIMQSGSGGLGVDYYFSFSYPVF